MPEKMSLIEKVYNVVLVPEGWRVEAANHPGEWEVISPYGEKVGLKSSSQEQAMLDCWDERNNRLIQAAIDYGLIERVVDEPES